MKELQIGKQTYKFLSKKDPCPICKTPRDEIYFSWNMFHGEATSSCCNSVYQLKDYFVEELSDETREMFSLFEEGYIQLTIPVDWIKPLQKAMKEVGLQDVNNDEVYELAKSIRK